MTKSKLATSAAKSSSKYQKRIDNLLKKIIFFQNLALSRKAELRKYHNFIEALISEKRVSKEELKPIFTKKENNIN